MSPLLPRWLSRHILLDLSPVRQSPDFRALLGGLGVSTLGNQLTAVSVPYQVYAITHSSLYVGLVSLVQRPGGRAGVRRSRDCGSCGGPRRSRART